MGEDRQERALIRCRTVKSCEELKIDLNAVRTVRKHCVECGVEVVCGVSTILAMAGCKIDFACQDCGRRIQEEGRAGRKIGDTPAMARDRKKHEAANPHLFYG